MLNSRQVYGGSNNGSDANDTILKSFSRVEACLPLQNFMLRPTPAQGVISTLSRTKRRLFVAKLLWILTWTSSTPAA